MALKLHRYFFQWKSNQSNESDVITLTNEDGLEDPGDADSEASMTDNEDSSMNENAIGQERLSVARRLCFVASLLLCAFTVLVFAFLLPCHKPGCHKTNSCPLNASKDWSVNFTSIIPSGIYLLDVTGNGHADVFVEATKGSTAGGTESNLKEVCEDAACFAGITAMRRESGESLWTFWRNTTLGPLTCNSDPKHPSCLLSEGSSHLLQINPQMGTVDWLSITQHTIHAYEFVRDADGDGVPDIVVLHNPPGELSLTDSAKINIVSGRTGSPLGMPVSIPGKHNSSNILVIQGSSEGNQFILVSSASSGGKLGSLWAISTADLARKMAQDGDEKSHGTHWGPYLPDPQTGFISLFDGIFVQVKPLLTDLNFDGVTDLVVCIKDPGFIILAVDGKTLGTLWKVALSSVGVDRLIAAGMSKKNNHTHIAAILTSANQTAALWVIDGQSGDVTWSFQSSTSFLVPPVSVPNSPTHHQAFLIWLPGSEAVKYLNDDKQNHIDSVHQNSSPFTDGNNGTHLEPHYSQKYGTDHQKNDSSMNSLDSNTTKESIGEENTRNGVHRNGDQGGGTTPVSSSHYDNNYYCGSEIDAKSHMLSAFLVSQDSDGSSKVQEVTSEKSVYLDPKEFERLFGQKLSTQRCVKLVPRNVVEPAVGDVVLVYAVDFVTEESVGSKHMMKIQKLNIQQAVDSH